jgi:O-antigen ligase
MVKPSMALGTRVPPGALPSGAAMSARNVGAGAIVNWWLRGVTFLVTAYIVASQTLTTVPSWSRLGVIIAFLLLLLLAWGRVMNLCRLRLENWIWIPSLFVGYCLFRSLSRPAFGNPPDVLSATVSAYLGGVGVALALQAGVRFRAFIYAQLLAGLCQIVAGFFGFGSASPSGEAEVRYSGLTGNANELGLELTLAACFIWLLPKKAGRIAASGAFLFTIYGVATTGSRQALLVAVFFALLVLVQCWSSIKRRFVLYGFIATGVGLAVLFLAPILLEHARQVTAVERALDYDSDSSYHKRLTMVHQGLRLWEEAPIFGNGLDSFRDLSGQGTYAHNDYVELLCDLGLVGALFFYAIHGNIMLRSLKLPGRFRICFLLFVFLLLAVDTGCVGYKRKQTVMLLMVLSATTNTLSVASFERRALAKRRNGLLREPPGKDASERAGIGSGFGAARLQE